VEKYRGVVSLNGGTGSVCMWGVARSFDGMAVDGGWHNGLNGIDLLQHSDLLAAPFLVKSHDINNPCHRITILNQPPQCSSR
jgi:hypothetical protein